MTRRVAVAIGVGVVHGGQGLPALTPLPGAVNGAADFAAWAKKQKFDAVHLLTDAKAKPVSAKQVKARIKAAVDAGDVEKLFVYFAGHGMAVGYERDYWLLSGALEEPAEIVDVSASLGYARHSQIPHVAVFSDACRTAESFEMMSKASGGTSTIFPPKPPSASTKLDVFYGSLPGSPAQEVTDNQIRKAYGVFTDILLKGLSGTERTLGADPTTGAVVVYASVLEAYLEEQVPRQAESIAGALTQDPDARVQSIAPIFLTEVEAPHRFKFTAKAEIPIGSQPADVQLAIVRVDPHALGYAVITKGNGVSLSASLPRFGVYGIEAEMKGHVQKPGPPDPIVRLRNDETQAVKLVPAPQRVATYGGGVGFLVVPKPEDRALASEYRLINDSTGEVMGTAPRDDVFKVVGEDVATGRTVMQDQRLRQGETPRPIPELAATPEEKARVDAIADLPVRTHFETGTGISVVGSQIRHVWPGYRPFFEGEAWNVRSEPPETRSVVLELDGDRYAAVAMLYGFIAEIEVGPKGVRHLSYTPPPASTYGGYPEQIIREARRSLALAEAAARRGVFRVAIDQSFKFAERIREYKHFDPVLGVFAAYAYHQVGRADEIRSMIRYFKSMGQAVPFDVYMLGGVQRNERQDAAPSYPLLTQGWFLMTPEDITHPAIAAARDNLAPSLWATVRGEAGRRLGEAIGRGEIR